MGRSGRKTGLGGIALALLISIGAAQTVGAAETVHHEKWHPWIGFGGYLSNERSRGEGTLWAPLWQSRTALVFTDIRGKVFAEDAQEGNVALGLRVMRPSGWNLGVWAGWDHRRTELDSSFNQVAFGLEALSDRFDVRANGYVPTNDRAHVATSQSTATSVVSTAEALLEATSLSVLTTETRTTTTTTTRLFEHALHGFDAEVGVRLPLDRMFGFRSAGTADGPASGHRRHELRLYGGGFWFDNDDVEEIAGPRARLEWRVNDVIGSLPGSRLTVEGEFQYDDVRKDQWEGGVRLRIPFGGRRGAAYAALTPQERRMMDGLERDTDVVTNDETTSASATTTRVSQSKEAAIDEATNVRLDRVAFATDAASLGLAVGQGANTLIIVQDTGANIDVSATDGQALQDSQTLQGGGSTIWLTGATTGVKVPFTAPGTRPTLFSNDTNFNTGVVTVASSTHVVGLNIQGGFVFLGNQGIRGGDGLSNVVIERNTISNFGGTGVHFDDTNRNVTVSGNTISNTNNFGVFFANFNSNVTVSDNTISNTDNSGVLFIDNNVNVWVSGNTISNPGADGVFFNDNNTNLTLSDNTFTMIGDDVFDFDGPGNTLLPGSTGNVVTDAPVGDICEGAGNVAGSLEVTDQNGVLQVFVDSAGCS